MQIGAVIGLGLLTRPLSAELVKNPSKGFLNPDSSSKSFGQQISRPIPFVRSDESRYQACLSLLKPEPISAIEYSQTWIEESADFAAIHCLALGLYHQGRMTLAASTLHNLAQAMEYSESEAAEHGLTPTESTPRLRSLVLAQAGVIFDLGGDSPSAERELSQAIGLNPNDLELYLDRALIRGKQNLWQLVLKDLNSAIKLLGGQNTSATLEALGLRATAERQLGEFKAARGSLDQVFYHSARDEAALIESGNLYLAVGDHNRARQAWLEVLKRREQGVMADLARSLLEKMDVSSGK
ncbi:MAG: hypothetical protein ORO03_08450 [Alphaproteobacteria bacterium]|nr:hypothetical protein [Alphaproteobacteria bacterium]